MKAFAFDWWTLVGLAAQGLFFLRFVVQWYFSEKAKKTVIPPLFWYLSLGGAVLSLTYALVRRDIVFMVAGVVQIAMYGRNLMFQTGDKVIGNN